jgi:hypothetical protein
MDRLKLETVYLRALDALMSADEYQMQAAIFRLRRAQARLHGWEAHSLQISTHPGKEPPSRFTSHRTLCVLLWQPRGRRQDAPWGLFPHFEAAAQSAQSMCFRAIRFPTVECRSEHHRGICSHHEGVAHWD